MVIRRLIEKKGSINMSDSIAAIGGDKKRIEDGIGAAGGYVAFNYQIDNSPINFSATGNGDPKGYREASIFTA